MELRPRNDLRSQSLDLLRFPLALFVVAVHVFTPLPYVTVDSGATAALFRFVTAFIKDQSVPVYFFIAGYVFFLGMRMSAESYAGKLRRRCSSLLMPYIAWNTLAILYLVKPLLPGMESLSDFSDMSGYDLSARAFIESFWDDRYGIIPADTGVTDGIYPVDKPLWFVRDLMIMAIVSPVIYGIYRLPGRMAAAVMGLVTALWWLHLPQLGHGAQLLEAFVFFGWGGLVSYHRRDMMIEFDRFFTASMILYPLLATAVLLLSPLWPGAMAYVKSTNIIIGLFFFYNLSAWLVGKGVCRSSRFLATASFFVYCGHFILIDPVGRRLYGLIGPEDTASTLCFYFATYLTVIGLLIGAYALLRRLAPWLLKLFTGGRL